MVVSVVVVVVVVVLAGDDEKDETVDHQSRLLNFISHCVRFLDWHLVPRDDGGSSPVPPEQATSDCRGDTRLNALCHRKRRLPFWC